MEGKIKIIKIHRNMQVQFLFLFLSRAAQGEKTAKCEKASSRWERAGGVEGCGERCESGGGAHKAVGGGGRVAGWGQPRARPQAAPAPCGASA